jgi:pyridoxamine 5'-phosphate oxidase
MDMQDCIKFASENPICFLSTLDGDQPRVRTWLLWYADESGFYFVSIAGKQVDKQLHASPRVEVCFFNNAANAPDWKHMRVTGKIEFLESEEVLAKAYEARTFLDPIVGRSVEPLVRPFRVYDGEARFWTLANFLKESEVEPIKF